ncbi:phosphatidylglycerophosphatase [Bacillus toyonensis]|uniref:metallophosphoesterase family protein n=1 Tax=Bacillus toyonensis TaxID=155322 RepID=UPI000BFC3357|nr:metallophosphoesterase [Bacillus toyonensis]PHE64204.1 phosphatidylglycerophosphatase [Bacillus toyonensis]
MLKISGSRVLVLGDIHADDTFQGRHYNYWENVVEVSNRIINIVEEEKPDLVIIAGDLVGVKRGVSTIKDRNALLYLAKFLMSLPNCVVLKGNHDYNEVSDYEFLSEMCAFKSTSQIGGVVEFTHPLAETPCYFHCIDYGQENELITIYENAYNIGIGHNEFFVEGQEQQYHGEHAIELRSKRNFFGLDMLLSGHIHTPSINFIPFSFQDGFESAFLNLGCPTRPSHGELYDQVWYVAFDFNKVEGTNLCELGYRTEVFKLRLYTEIFRPKSDFIEEVQSDEAEDPFTGVQKGKLEEIIGSMVTTNMGSDDFLAQVDRVLLVDDDVKNMAKKYLIRGMNV